MVLLEPSKPYMGCGISAFTWAAHAYQQLVLLVSIVLLLINVTTIVSSLIIVVIICVCDSADSGLEKACVQPRTQPPF